MKTFRLISLEVFENDAFREIEIVDGLIINKEDEHNTWLIEVYTKPGHFDFFEKAVQTQQDYIIRVVISKKDNDPVSFHIKARSVRKLEKNITVMLYGTLRRNSRKNYAEGILRDLMNNGLSGDTLLKEFRERMKKQPYLTPATKIAPITPPPN